MCNIELSSLWIETHRCNSFRTIKMVHSLNQLVHEQPLSLGRVSANWRVHYRLSYSSRENTVPLRRFSVVSCLSTSIASCRVIRLSADRRLFRVRTHSRRLARCPCERAVRDVSPPAERPPPHNVDHHGRAPPSRSFVSIVKTVSE